MVRTIDGQRTADILQAAEELLIEVGYDNVGVRDVADRAAVGLGTIYRRWPTKEALIAAALEVSRSGPLPEADSPREAIVAFVEHRAAYFVANEHVFPSLIAAGQHNEELAKAASDNMRRNVDVPLRVLVGDYIGDDHAHLNIASELAGALLIYRLTMLHRPVEPHAFSIELIELIDTVANSEPTLT